LRMIRGFDPLLQALFAGFFTWGVTALGAAMVFVIPSNSKKFLDVSLGFASGVMTAASFWSLLAPAIEISETKLGSWAFLPVAVGFICGGAFVAGTDRLIPSCVVAEMSILRVFAKECVEPSADQNDGAIPHAPALNEPLVQQNERTLTITDNIELTNGTQVTQQKNLTVEEQEQFMVSWRRILLLIMAVTVHNIPEGLAVGVGFGSIGSTKSATFESAFNLALGIGLQNFPEGLAVSLPLAGFGYSRFRAFIYGQLSGMVEPIAALLGAAVIVLMEPVLPYALSFAAGAMIYVVFDDIIPEAQRNGNGKLASFGAMVGFTVMMSLDVGLG